MHPIIWTEGAFLSQQHFQYWQAWLLNQQNRLINLTMPDAYGLVSCEIDPDGLRLQKIEIKSLVLRTQQGEWIIYENSQQRSLAMTLEDLDSQTIYLNTPKNKLCSGLSGYEGAGEQAAYEAEYVQLEDLYDTKRTHEVTRGVQRLRLSTHPLDPQVYESWPIVKLNRLVGTQFSIDEKFLPQSLTISASQSLREMVKQLLNDLSDKSNLLRTQIERSHQTELKEHYALLAQAYYEIKEMQSHGTDHPRRLYQLLAKLVMRLGVINDRITTVESYNHLAISDCLFAIKEQLKLQLDQKVETLPSFVMTKQNHSYPSLENIDQEYTQGYSWYLGIDFSHQPQESVLKFTNQAKLGTVKTLSQMIASALPGIQMNHQLRAPKQIRYSEGYEYFKLDHEGLDWKHVKEERSLMLYLPAALESKKITLDIIKD